MNDTDIRRPPYRPLFLVFDGMDGSGQTTQMNLLADRLRAEGVPVAVTAEPTASPDGKRLGQALSVLSQPAQRSWQRFSCWIASGHNLAKDGIDACLRAGVTVLCDRYYYSSIAYRGRDDSARMAWLCRMNLDCPAVRRPDACLLFDLEPETAMRRITGEPVAPRPKYTKHWSSRHVSVPDSAACGRCWQSRITSSTVDAAGNREDIARQVYTLWQELALG